MLNLKCNNTLTQLPFFVILIIFFNKLITDIVRNIYLCHMNIFP